LTTLWERKTVVRVKLVSDQIPSCISKHDSRQTTLTFYLVELQQSSLRQVIEDRERLHGRRFHIDISEVQDLRRLGIEQIERQGWPRGSSGNWEKHGHWDLSEKHPIVEGTQFQLATW